MAKVGIEEKSGQFELVYGGHVLHKFSHKHEAHKIGNLFESLHLNEKPLEEQKHLLKKEMEAAKGGNDATLIETVLQAMDGRLS